MKCAIELEWRGISETMRLTREKEPDEVWTTPGGTRNLHQAIAVLEATYRDARAAMIAMLPPAERADYEERA